MTVFLMTFAGMLLIVMAMCVGVMMGGEPVKGSCGGMSALGMDTACDVCNGDPKQCEKSILDGMNATADDDLVYDAMLEPSER